MKRNVTFVCLTVLLFLLPRAQASPHPRRITVRTSTTRRVTVGKIVIPSTQEIKSATLFAACLREKFPGYAEKLLGDPRFRFDMRVIMKPVALVGYPPERFKAKPLPNYMLTAKARNEGFLFLERNTDLFDSVERQFKTPKREEVAAIFDAEDMFGTVSLGRYSVFQTLYTIAVFRPNLIRRGWAEKELVALIETSRENGTDPFSIKGSRRGAFGLPQFEPTSYRLFAMHFDGKRCVAQMESPAAPDLWGERDAICSAANYLHRTGRAGERMFLRYNHSKSYARSCVKAAALWKKPKNVRAALK